MKLRLAYVLAAAAIITAGACKHGKTDGHDKLAGTQDTTVQDTTSHVDELRISFTMADMNGNNVAVTDEFAKHKVTIVDFWASWCGPCRQEMPNLVKTYNEWGGKRHGNDVDAAVRPSRMAQQRGTDVRHTGHPVHNRSGQ